MGPLIPFGPIDFRGSRPIWNWEDPKTQLGHIWADNILYFIPDS